MIKQIVKLKVNGEFHEVAVEPRMTLRDVLRESLGLTGTKNGCSLGNCGSCTVLLDGKPVVSCLLLAIEAQGKEILTIEGLSENGQLHPVQQAFIDHSALQCGFCTPGMVLSAKALLDNNPNPTEDEIKEAISGNLCRCTGYVDIVETISDVSKELKED
ncbi:MAG TPA: (2Fe-2S)-binding protein [Desulfobacteraceae bacterium]|nr:(2Fe-2S)-binding protein [Desulfobacteraceae bacterium]HPJ67708.1 (2Fe-2S)-binding protein [Desulfobacteraceae bacterium]HPQ29421.1 (2Fe-2S)-binding protein [Desulfobacteraceae bacterium]